MSENLVDYILNQYNNSDKILIDDESENWVTKKEFKEKIDYWSKELPDKKSIIFAYVDNKIEHLAFTFACFYNNHCLALLDNNLPKKSKDNLNILYKPKYIFSDNGKKISLDKYTNHRLEIFKENLLMLSTSGSTGSPKFVVLSNTNIFHNALKISKILNISKDSVASGYLPFHYSYGFSVISSHLVSGAKVALTELSLTQSDFWKKWIKMM